MKTDKEHRLIKNCYDCPFSCYDDDDWFCSYSKKDIGMVTQDVMVSRPEWCEVEKIIVILRKEDSKIKEEK
jgi:hypothetical protein